MVAVAVAPGTGSGALEEWAEVRDVAGAAEPPRGHDQRPGPNGRSPAQVLRRAADTGDGDQTHDAADAHDLNRAGWGVRPAAEPRRGLPGTPGEYRRRLRVPTLSTDRWGASQRGRTNRGGHPAKRPRSRRPQSYPEPRPHLVRADSPADRTASRGECDGCKVFCNVTAAT